MKIVPVRWIDEVLDLALERPLTPNAVAEGVKETIEDATHDSRPARRAAGCQALIFDYALWSVNRLSNA